MSDASLDEKNAAVEEQNIRRPMVADHTTPSVLKNDRVGGTRRDRQAG
jgi:hypothetical protein